MEVRPEDCKTLITIARSVGYNVKAGHISREKGYDIIRGAIIMFMMAFNIPAEACDDVCSLVFDYLSYTIEKPEDNE